ncbi:MAG: endonuclease/exonuclease/phosphatase family protein [Bacteroidales bacterium]
MSRLRHLGLLLCVIPALVHAQEETIVFHNVENLFYPLDDPLTLDNDFTIEGRKHWTFERYKSKLNALAKTYISIEDKQTPALIGLCEVENNQVLDALTKDTPLRKIGYRYLHYPSKDIRGIDVALLYDPKKFKVIESFPMPSVSDRREDRTRDVLYVKGILGKMILNIYVIHAPSRRENNKKKDLRQRIFASIYEDVRKKISSGDEYFIVMGDMNDNPWDKTLLNGFHLEDHNNKNPQLLFDLMIDNKDKTGSYVYGGNMFSFDQFLVSNKVKQRIVLSDSCKNTFVYKPEFLITKSKRQKYARPFSTYKGMKYEGGISDHFPIIMKIKTD